LSALPIAIGFGITLNTLLLLKFLYPTWLSPFLLTTAMWVGLVAWICWTIKSVRELPALIAPREVSEEPDRFMEAQQAYLRGEWSAAESMLLSILAVEPRDPPALLLLSGVYRHTERADSAVALVDELKRLEIADAWQIEIHAETARIDRALKRGVEQSDPEASEPEGSDSEGSGIGERGDRDNASEVDERTDPDDGSPGSAADLTAA
jgi:hypothetical protein